MPIFNPTAAFGTGGASLDEEQLIAFLASLMVDDNGAFVRTNDGGFVKAYELQPSLPPDIEAFILDTMGSIVVTDIGTFVRAG